MSRIGFGKMAHEHLNRLGAWAGLGSNTSAVLLAQKALIVWTSSSTYSVLNSFGKNYNAYGET